ncbi:MAG TPA: hypothetical protein VGQ83_35515 [Polyangia bacterium]|jgi:hypothetical protein
MRVPSLIVSAVALVCGAATGCSETPEPKTGPPAQYTEPQPQSQNPQVTPQVQPQPMAQPQPPQGQYQLEPEEQYRTPPHGQYQPPPGQYQPQPQYQPLPEEQYQTQPQYQAPSQPQLYSSPFGMFYPQALTTLSAVVVAVRGPGPQAGAGQHVVLTVRRGNEILLVDTGPSWFLHQLGAAIYPGDYVTLTGSRSFFQGRPVLIATRVVQGGRVLDLRAPSGRPVWYKQGGG